LAHMLTVIGIDVNSETGFPESLRAESSGT
jgi:hypothetical protein